MSRLDLLLVNAPSRTSVYGPLSDLAAIEPPVWAGLIARHCLNRGFSVEILDAEAEGLSVDQTAWRIAEKNPRLAAFCIYGHQPSASTQCLPAAGKVADVLRTHLQGNSLAPIQTLALGTHPSALPKRTLREEPFDYVCQGEGPATIAALLSQSFGIPEPGGVLSIPGLWGNALPPWGTMGNITDLDNDLPGQAWGLLDMTRYRAHNWHLWGRSGHQRSGYASVQTSLGCVFRCEFCCIQAPFGDVAPRMRYWSPENVADQIDELGNLHDIWNIKIPDEMFVLNRQHVREICERLIKKNIGQHLNMWAYARVDTVKDEEMLALMRRAGFRWLGIGIESASKHVRDGVEKGRFGNEEIIAAVRRVQTAGICVGANYIFGLPDDTRESCAETLALACELNTEYANFYCAMAYPGSPLHAQVSKTNPSALPENNPCGWLGYSQHAYESMPLPTDALTYQEVIDIRDGAFMRYFTRPKYLDMMQGKFGDGVVEQIERMTALGEPRRQHRK